MPGCGARDPQGKQRTGERCSQCTEKASARQPFFHLSGLPRAGAPELVCHVADGEAADLAVFALELDYKIRL